MDENTNILASNLHRSRTGIGWFYGGYPDLGKTWKGHPELDSIQSGHLFLIQTLRKKT